MWQKLENDAASNTDKQNETTKKNNNGSKNVVERKEHSRIDRKRTSQRGKRAKGRILATPNYVGSKLCWKPSESRGAERCRGKVDAPACPAGQRDDPTVG